jgi:outer membrane autotransporter protein
VLAYGGWHDEALYVTAIAGASFSDIGSTRSLAVAGLGNANGSFSGETYSAYGEGGYTMMPWDGLRLTPYLGLLYAHAHTDAFTETGGAIGPLSVPAVSGDSLVSTLAARLAMPINVGGFGTVVPEVRAGWQHEFLDIGHNINVAFAATPAPGSPFLITGATVGRDSALVGVGVTHDLNADTRVFLDYDGLVTGGIAQHAFSAGLRIKF